MTFIPNTMLLRNPGAIARQSGVSLIEILGALTIGAIMVTGLASLMDSSLDDVKGQQAAYYQSQLVAAGQKYIAANAGDLRTSLPNGAALRAVSVQQLIDDRFLSASTGPRNVYGQTPCLLIRQPDPSARPGQFDALVATSGGEPIPERMIAMVAANAGPSGGYISASDTGNAKGASWSSSTAAFRSAACAGGGALSGGGADGGHLASNLFHGGPGQLASDFLYRSEVPGMPELNRMNTPVRMAQDALVEVGDSCLDQNGENHAALAFEASSRALLVCGQGGTWRAASQWKDPVASYASLSALPAAGNLSGDVRMVRDLARAFTWNGASWAPLAVDQNGDLTVPRDVHAENMYASQKIESLYMKAGKDINAGGTIKAIGDISTEASMSAKRDITAGHNVVTEGLQVNVWASSPAISIELHYHSPGDACHYLEFDPVENMNVIVFPMGTVVMDVNHTPLICGIDRTMRYANGTHTP